MSTGAKPGNELTQEQKDQVLAQVQQMQVVEAAEAAKLPKKRTVDLDPIKGAWSITYKTD